MTTLYYESELYHHGIKGMKWGVRRFRKKDGTLTPSGKKRYADDDGGRKQTKEEKPAKETRYDKLYSKYKTLGYSDKKAEQAARGQVRTERTLKIIGGAAVTAAIAYGAYRYYDLNADRFISPDKVMQTVHKGDAAERLSPNNPFYATYTKRDNTIYSSKVFTHFDKESTVTKFRTKDGIKVASEKSSRKVFDELMHDPEVAGYMKDMGYSKRTSDPKKLYEYFNYSLVLRNDSETAKKMGVSHLDHDAVHNKFYNALKQRGYGALIDTNDSRREGFTYNPVIVFDNQMKDIVASTKATKEQLGSKQYFKGAAWSSLRMKLNNPIDLTDPVTLYGGIAYAGSLGVAVSTNKALEAKVKYVEQYKKEHPNTNMTNAQISKMYDKEKGYMGV